MDTQNQTISSLSGVNCGFSCSAVPAFHNLETATAREINLKTGIEEMEVTDEVFNGEQSYVYQQAENRMHTIKAVMAATINKV